MIPYIAWIACGVAILTSIIAYIPAQEFIFISTRTGRKLKGIGKLFLIALLLFIISPLVQGYFQSKIDIEKEINQNNESTRKENDLRQKFNSVNKQLNTIRDNLGEFDLKIDSGNNIIVKTVKNSEKGSENRPILSVADLLRNKVGIEYINYKDNYYNYSLTFTSLDAASSSFSVKNSFVILDSILGYFYLADYQTLDYNSKMSTGQGSTFSFKVKDVFKVDKVFIWSRGTYKSAKGDKTYFINDVNANIKECNASFNIVGSIKDTVIAIAKKALRSRLKN